MAKTLALGKVYPPFGRGMRMAIGTQAAHSDGSFTITEPAGGSRIMRNIQSVMVTPMNGTYYVGAYGSSDGYVYTAVKHLTPEAGGTVVTAAGTVDINFVAFGGFGSL